MSVNPITPTPEDLITLSSYIDGELSASEQEALEQRLSTDEGLRTELDSLRETVELVQSLPLLKAPRNFTLDPTVYAPTPKSKTVSFISRKTVWRLGTAAGIAASFLLVFVVILMGGADDSAEEQSSNSLDQPISMANDNVAADQNLEQTAAVAQSTQVALSTTSESDQEETTRSFAATEVAFGEDESTKATSLPFDPTMVLSQTPISPENGNEPSITAGIDEARDDMPPVATRTIVALLYATQTSEGYIGQTATQLARNTTRPPNSGGGNAQDGQPGETGGNAEESEIGDTLPPSGAFMSTPTPSPFATASPRFTSVPTGTATPAPQIFDDEGSSDGSDVSSAERPESATDALDDTTDTSIAIGTSDADEDVADGAVAASEAEASEEDVAAMPPAPNDAVTILREIVNFILERLLGLISCFSR